MIVVKCQPKILSTEWRTYYFLCRYENHNIAGRGVFRWGVGGGGGGTISSHLKKIPESSGPLIGERSNTPPDTAPVSA